MPAIAPAAQRKAPLDTLRDIQGYLKEAGVTRLCNITGMDRIGIPVYASVRPDSQSLAVDSGKGFEPEQAKCSAAMESLERYWCDEAKLVEWEGYVIPNSVTDFPLARGAHFNPVYQHIWTEAKVWTSRDFGAARAVPYYFVKIYDKELPLYQMCWQSGTNGLASGNDMEEAICSGLYELIERDAVSIYMYGDSPKRIDLDSIEHEDCREMLDMCENTGIGVYVYDVTSNIDIPVFVCIMVDEQIQVGMYKGCGAHLDSHIAIRRAICEAAQSRAVFIAGARDDMAMTKQKTMRSMGTAMDWNASLSSEETTNYVSRCQELSNKDAIIYVEDILRKQKCGRVLVVEMCDKPNLAVVRVMVSGLEGYWNAHLERGRRALR